MLVVLVTGTAHQWGPLRAWLVAGVATGSSCQLVAGVATCAARCWPSVLAGSYWLVAGVATDAARCRWGLLLAVLVGLLRAWLHVHLVAGGLAGGSFRFLSAALVDSGSHC